jgi:hypothetical protein
VVAAHARWARVRGVVALSGEPAPSEDELSASAESASERGAVGRRL